MKKALLFSLFVLVVLELVTRFVLFPESKDFIRFAGYDEKAAALAHADALRVAIVSNSSAEEGIDRAQLELLLSRALGSPVRVEMFLADGSEIVTWHAMLNRYFWSTGARADVYVLNYFDSLRDTPHFEYLRVGMFFARFGDWHYYLSAQLNTFAERVQFVLSSVWATYGARDRLRDRVLSVFVPGYRDFVEVLHWSPRTPTSADARPETGRFSALDRILLETRRQGARLVLTAFPLRSSRYELDPEVLSMSDAGLLSMCDLRHVPQLAPASYRDDIHLIASGRSVFTQNYAAALAPVLIAQ